MKINREPDKNKQVYHAQPQSDPPRRKAYDVMADHSFEESDEQEEEQTAPRRHRFPIVALVIILIFLGLVGYGGYRGYELYSELDGAHLQGGDLTVTVEQGSSVADIANDLENAGVIQNAWLFRLYAKYSGKAEGLQYGDFVLRAGMSYNDIIKTLSVQQVRRETVTLTFPEGTTSVEIAQQFVDNGLVDSVQTFLDCANGADGSDFSQYPFWNEIPDNPGCIMKCEGYLFPDTYEFYTDDTVYNYVDTFYKEFDKKTSGLMDSISEKGTTLSDVVILASFIQEEAGKPEDDAKVSAVFHNRLESDDPNWAEHKLESNACSYITADVENNYLWNSPVAAYMGWVEAGEIPEDVLNAYDTYRVSGLPAGAISNPGYDAIYAALNPDQTYIDEGYFFFVTGNPNGDYPGQYFYAKTLDEHNANCVLAGWPQ